MAKRYALHANAVMKTKEIQKNKEKKLDISVSNRKIGFLNFLRFIAFIILVSKTLL